jgi:hypothetical protein
MNQETPPARFQTKDHDMTDRARRKQLVSNYKENPPAAGVYRVINTQTGKSLIGSTTNLESMHSKLRFARKTGSGSALDLRLRDEVRQYGIDAFEVEIVEKLERRADMSDAELRSELKVLEALCREQFQTDELY